MAKNEPAERMKRKDYEKHLEKLQIELCHLQDFVKANKLRVIVLFEGRDAAGKGGTIKAITEKVSPRVFRVVALPAPSDREKTQLFFQRYMEQFPAGGEIVIFDRSWYNRAGVEYVMGFCTPKEHDRFWRLLQETEPFAPEKTLFIDDNLDVLRSAAAYGISHLLAVPRPDSTREAMDTEEFRGLGAFDDILGFFRDTREASTP